MKLEDLKPSELPSENRRFGDVSRTSCPIVLKSWKLQHVYFLFPKQFTVRGSQCFKEWSPWCWMVWSGSPSSFHLSPNSFHVSPRLGGCGRVPGWLVCLPLLFTGWALVVGFPAGLSPTSFRHFLSFVSHFFSFVSHFFSLSPRLAGCRPACLPLPFICLPLLFTCLPVLFTCLPGYSFVPQACHCWCPPFSAGHAAFLFICFPGLSLVLPPFSAGHVAFLFICLPCDFLLFVFQVWCLHCCFLPLEQVRL